MTNVVGYARVSKRDQNPAAQEAELRAAWQLLEQLYQASARFSPPELFKGPVGLRFHCHDLTKGWLN